MISKRSGSGAHSSLLIGSRQRVLFDPAGSFQATFTPERHDVLFGMTDPALAAYIDFHARDSHDVIEQRLVVSAEVAERVTRLAMSHGPVPQAQCALSISRMLAGVPGFKSIRPGYFPRSLSRDFGRIPGVQSRVISDGKGP